MIRMATLALLACAIALPAGAEDLSHFSGSFRYSGGVGQQQALHREIERVIGQMNPIIRLLARRRIHRSLTIPSRVEIDASGSPVAVQMGGESLRPAPTRVEAGTLVHRGNNGEGSRSTTLELSEDGRELVVQIDIDSNLLPDHVVYLMSFEREESPFAVSAGPADAGG